MSRKGFAFFRTLCLIATCALLSCSAKAEGIPFTEDELPDMIMKNATYTYGKPDKNPLFMVADKITIYNTNSRTILENVSFIEKNGEKIILEGTCDSASSKSNSHVTLSGNVKLSKRDDDITIEAEKIEWDDDSRSITAEGRVTVFYNDGTTVTAEGFRALLDKNIYEFARIIEGTYVSGDENE